MICIDNTEIDKYKITYPNGEFGYSLPLSPTLIGWVQDTKSTVFIDYKYESTEVGKDMFDLYFISSFYREKNVNMVLNLEYLPFSRMDRIKHNKEVFTLKYFANFINSLNFQRVCVLDPHSDVSLALFNNIFVEYPTGSVIELINDLGIDLLCYPDAGATKKYSSMYSLPYVYGTKNRDWSTGKITSFDINLCGQDVQDKNILIVDDICSKGGTFLATATKLKELGANKVYLFVSHCEKSILEGLLLSNSSTVDKVFFKNPLFTSGIVKSELNPNLDINLNKLELMKDIYEKN